MTVMSDNDSTEQTHPQTQAPSKSQRKRDADALRALGEQLVALKPAQLADFPLDHDLLAAIHAAQAMRSHGARRRQLQYIGKLMRQHDPEPIQTALATLQQTSLAAKTQQHMLERMVTALLANEAAALADFLQRYPATDRQQLRHLIRKAQAEQQHQRPPQSRRALFRFLRSAVEADESDTFFSVP